MPIDKEIIGTLLVRFSVHLSLELICSDSGRPATHPEEVEMLCGLIGGDFRYDEC